MKREKRTVRDSVFGAALVLALGALLLTNAAVAEARHGGGKWGGHKTPFARLLEHRTDLGLSNDQVSRIESIQSRIQGDVEQRRTAVREKRRALHELMQSENVDRAEVDRRIDDLSADMTELHRIRAHAMLEAREILTPDQRAKLQEMKREWKRDHFGGRDRSGGQEDALR